ncbi:UDP-GlcNAc:betaGal beta-1,3-N-acetylglucosaminyltransferase 9 isoform X1 [Gadus macrocephalus]|uniref:UDP-GlcNAc:betaGal beta-1,3-N-acetylglucosaminyltransferase 9 isoform X1 n=1 Tax=Gadus macrocephalus TaxID=80720 RepID=UPI0028CB4298|nr:UDP-GlcNAc:betaGal beta-1,3-N-acetylglucosaminyltransferase 9 isoform X1 [Gadus macrocephalus]
MMMRKVRVLRKIFHVQRDVMFTMVLLLFFCLLLYTQQVLLQSGWDRTVWRLEIEGSTSSSRVLLGAVRTRTGSGSQVAHAGPEVPACKTQPEARARQPDPKRKVKPSQAPLAKTKRKRKGLRGRVTPTNNSGDVKPTMPPFDFEAYLREKDNRDFGLRIDQPQKCMMGEGEPDGPYMLIAVKSVAADFDKRQVVRQTWGRERPSQHGVTLRTVFLLGVPRNQSALPLWDRLLLYESNAYKDILLWDFEDTFFNLTLKETHFLQWVNSSCPRVRFIFKGDADVYVNIENILEMLQDKDAGEDLFIGDIIVHAKPIRKRTSKYYVPEFMYGGGLYPSYAGGGGFVMSGHTARRLSAACQQVELFPIDDVFLGMCLQRIAVKPYPHKGFRTFGIPRPSAAPHLQTFDPCFYRDLMVVHSLTPPQIWLMWNLLHDPHLRCHTGGTPSTGTFRWSDGGAGGRAGGRAATVDPEEGEELQTTDYGLEDVFVKH